MALKYKDFHGKLPCECPELKEIKEIETSLVYRFVHEDLNHPNNFLPPYIISPKRANDPSEHCNSKCQGYALSLYTSETKATKKLQHYIDHKPGLKQVLGNCIAEGQLDVPDGMVDTPKKGHFNLYENEGVNLMLKFKIVKILT